MIVQKKIMGVVVSLSLVSLASFVHAADAGNVTSAMLDNTAKNPASVLSFGMGTQGQRYSPLTQINDKTVAKLVPAWSFSFGG